MLIKLLNCYYLYPLNCKEATVAECNDNLKYVE